MMIRDQLQSLAHVPLSVGRAWHHFWFAPCDPLPLAFMRWLVGGMLLYTHVVWGLQLEQFLGDDGWNGRSLVRMFQQDEIAPSFWWWVSAEWYTTVHVISLSILFCFWIGLATRMTSVLALLITISYAYRTQLANFGLDQINAILCLYLAIGPSGARLSVDQFLRSRWRKRKSKNSRSRSTSRQRRILHDDGKFRGFRILGDRQLLNTAKSSSANFALRLVQIHFCVIYAYAGLSKLQGPAWWSGEATWLAFANLEYQSLDMTWLAWYPWLSDLMTHSTILWEISFAALIWVRPIRPVVLAVGFGLHFGIGAAMGMWTFGLIMIFGHVAFWPPDWVSRVAALLPSFGRSSEPARLPADAAREVAAARPANRLPLPASSVADASYLTTVTGAAATAKSTAPQLVYVDRAVDRRADTLRYFLQRGFRCVASDELVAHQISMATHPDAVVLLATEMKDEEIEAFHRDHCQRQQAEPLFLVMNRDQSDRLNGHVHTAGAHVVTGKVSLGSLRREIQSVLKTPNRPPAATPSSIQQN